MNIHALTGGEFAVREYTIPDTHLHFPLPGDRFSRASAETCPAFVTDRLGKKRIRLKFGVSQNRIHALAGTELRCEEQLTQPQLSQPGSAAHHAQADDTIGTWSAGVHRSAKMGAEGIVDRHSRIAIILQHKHDLAQYMRREDFV